MSIPMTTSIRLSLLKWLILPLLIINVIAAVLIYRMAWEPANNAFDEGLTDTAWAVVPRLKQTNGQVMIDLPPQAEQVLRVGHFDPIYFVVRDNTGKTIAGDGDFPSLKTSDKLDYPTAYDGMMRSGGIRVITLKTMIGSEPVSIGVAETLRRRHQIRSEIVAALLVLEGLLALMSMAIVWLAVSRGLHPLKKMQAALDSRNYNDLSLIAPDFLALELRPVVNALNDLLGRVQVGAAAQRDFVADIAHQLRTPLAGLKMQIEWLQQRYATEAETSHSIQLMMSSTERLIRQTNQFLSLARAESSQFEQTHLEQVELNKLVEESVQHFIEEADKKNIDLGFDLHTSEVTGNRFLLRDMIDNLIDNAIRYSPPQASVTVSCRQEGGRVTLIVEDSGPGIAASEQELIFNRFYRISDKTTGSGLGLSIVRDIAKDHGAEIKLAAGADGKGTVFSVLFPNDSQPASAKPS
ncbi:sensor histidine kinase [Undibacterium terreum]|uniref:histidine kinase n=1 Tax=Undibacterium terreum TaxID=1224302 RepID=A0A916UBY2_9BURK|nr:sensor histidine kinase [Undibacterium terreum]GGC67829.1 sensor histidine kinase [Undibacterium terreum]